jgi:hypothetical protein
MKNGFSASCAWTGETKTRAALSQKTKPLLRPDRSSKNKICKGRQEIEKQPSEKPAVTTISKKTLSKKTVSWAQEPREALAFTVQNMEIETTKKMSRSDEI